jgi:hypothetical protein
MDQAYRDAGRVKKPGRQNETKAIEQRVLPRWKFGAMRVSMKQTEYANLNTGHPKRRAQFE